MKKLIIFVLVDIPESMVPDPDPMAEAKQTVDTWTLGNDQWQDNEVTLIDAYYED